MESLAKLRRRGRALERNPFFVVYVAAVKTLMKGQSLRMSQNPTKTPARGISERS